MIPPFKKQFRWIPLPLVEEAYMHLWEMFDSGTICPSQSAWCNAVVLVWKKDGGLCFCIDFWYLNAHTKKDSYALPRIQEALESLVGAGNFSCLDLKSGFWQIKMDESSKQYTAFHCWQPRFLQMWRHAFWTVHCPSHVSVADAKLPRGVESDILSHLSQLSSHPLPRNIFTNYMLFLTEFREHNLKLKPLKCNFFKEEIIHFAHWVSKEGVQPSNLNLKAIAECTLPQTYTEVHAFLGIVGHYRRFIKGLTCIAQPLNGHLTRKEASRKSEWVSLLDDALKAFKVLKQACMTVPMLTLAHYTKPFLLEMDASKDRPGMVLFQKQADRWYHPVTYGSRALTPHEKNCHSTMVEFLALKWAVTEHFKQYLPYQPFLVKTDNSPLTYKMTTANLDATGH